MDVNYENGCNCGEQAGLYSQENQMNTATDAHAKRILTKIKVMSKSSSYFFINSSHIRRLHAENYCRIRRGRYWKIRGGPEREMAILVERTLLGPRLSPHGVLRGAGERSEGGFVPNSLRETRRAKSGQ